MPRSLLLLTIVILLGGCVMRYGHIPRTGFLSKQGDIQQIRSKTKSKIPELITPVAIMDTLNGMPRSEKTDSLPQTSERLLVGLVEQPVSRYKDYSHNVRHLLREEFPVNSDSAARVDRDYQSRRIAAGSLFGMAVLFNALVIFGSELSVLFFSVLLSVFFLVAVVLVRTMYKSMNLNIRYSRTERQQRLRIIAGILLLCSASLYGLVILAFIIAADILAIILSVPAFILLVLAVILFLSSLMPEFRAF